MVWLLFGVFVVVTSTAIYWWGYRPELRERRLQPLRQSLHATEKRIELSVREEQKPLLRALSAWTTAEHSADRAREEARMWPVPVPDLPLSGEAPETSMRRIAHLLDNPKIVAALAGGEQLAANLFDSLTGGSLDHLLEAAAVLHRDGLLQLALSPPAAMPGAVANYLTSHIAQHALDHHGLSIDILHDLPASTVHVLSQAGHEAAQAFDPSHFHGAHFPFARMITSMIREGSLLFDERISVQRALGNVAIDTAGTGVGALAGGKAGAMIGTAFGGPVGTAVGALLGAVAGSIAGSFGAHAVRHRKLTAAVENHKVNYYAIQNDLRAASHHAVKEVHVRANEVKQWHMDNLPQAPRIGELAYQDENLRSSALDLRFHVESAFREYARRLGEHVEQASLLIPRKNLFASLAGLDVSDIAWASLATAKLHISEALSAWLKQLPEADLMPKEMLSCLATLPIPAQTDKIYEGVANQAMELVPRYQDVFAHWIARATAIYETTIKSIADVAQVEVERYKASYEAGAARLRASEATVTAAKWELGI
jgi:hypothetical protein